MEMFLLGYTRLRRRLLALPERVVEIAHKLLEVVWHAGCNTFLPCLTHLPDETNTNNLSG
jgi:hypothetical protein